jgi:hypothetical protein
MGTTSADLFQSPLPTQRRRQPSWEHMSPLVWAPIMYTSRVFFEGRVKTAKQQKILIWVTLTALCHAGYVRTPPLTPVCSVFSQCSVCHILPLL